MQYPNQVIPRDALILTLTDDLHNFDPHRLDSMIHQLRRKVLAALNVALPLDAVYGHGYLFATNCAGRDLQRHRREKHA